MIKTMLAFASILFLTLVPLMEASGSIELIISSPQTIIIETTVCAEFECYAADSLSPARKVQENVPLRFETIQYQGESRHVIDVHFNLLDPKNHKVIALKHYKPLADTEWNKIVMDGDGYNVTVELRNLCAPDYYGKRCGRHCLASKERNHWECSKDGERFCSPGWTGHDCSIPVCAAGCNGRGRCVAPNQCSCATGFNGTRCEQCLPRPGCVYGDCHNNVPMTCKCRPGFIGPRCDININICSSTKPCQNGGICSIDSTVSEGFQCKCPFNFLGQRCETPLSSVRCSNNAEHVCQNGGVCFSTDDKTIQCKCRRGFTGKFCEIGTHRDCSTMKCSANSMCHMSGDVPLCIEISTTTMAPKELNYKKTEPEKEMMMMMDEFQTPLILVIIIGLLIFTCTIFILLGKKNRRNQTQTTPSTIPQTPLSQNPSRIYKVCVVDAENGVNGSDSDSDLCRHHHSPPPAYSSPVVPRLYKSIPTHDDLSFRKLEFDSIDV